MDDGTVARLGEDEFFVTVTSGNTAALERWITWWNADWGLDVRVLNLTGAYAAVNLAGPASRDVMRSLTDADVSAEAVPYLSATTMDVAGVPALVLRIGFVGELGYEIHVPSHVSGSTCGTRSWRPARTRASGRSAWRRSGSSGWRRAHPGRAGHGRRVRPVRGRSAAGRSRRTRTDFLGKRGLEGLDAEAAGRAARRLHVSGDVGAARGRERGRRRRVGGSRHLGAQERRGRGHRRPGLGARGLGERRDARSRSSSAPTARTRPSRCGRSTTPRARGSGRERTRPSLAARTVRTRISVPCRTERRGGSSSRTTATRRPNAGPCANGRGGRRDGAGQDRCPGFAGRCALGGGRRPHREDRRRLGAPAERARGRWRSWCPRLGSAAGPRRDGDRRDAPVRRVRARGTAAAGDARPADLVGPRLARGGRGDRRADRRRPSRPGPSRRCRWRCWRCTSPPSSLGTPGRRCSMRCAGRAGRRSAGDALRAEGWS